MSNLYTTTALTEFTPLSPEQEQSSVGSFFSKVFSFKTNQTDGNENNEIKTKPVVNHDQTETFTSQALIAVDARNLPNILKRVGNLLPIRSGDYPSYKNTDLKQYWMPDSVSKECYDCCEKFTTFRRRHHCRVCGQIFCSKCCYQEIPGKIMGCSGDLRVCTYCCKVVLSYLQTAAKDVVLSPDLVSLRNELQLKLGNNEVLSNCNVAKKYFENIVETTNSPSRKISVGYQEENFALSRSSTLSNLSPIESTEDPNVTGNLNNLFEEITQMNGGLNLKTHRYHLRSYHSCFLGHNLIDWLLSHGKVTSRMHGTAIGQVLLDAGYIEDVMENQGDFVDGNSLYRFCSVLPYQTNKIVKSTNKNSKVYEKQSSNVSNGSFKLDLDLHNSTAQISKPQKLKQNLVVEPRPIDILIKQLLDTIAKTYHRNNFGTMKTWNAPKKLGENYNEAYVFNFLTNIFDNHKLNFVKQMLKKNGLSNDWLDTLIALSDLVIGELSPDLSTDTENMSICHYLQIKKLEGGERSDSCIVSGIVCSKNIANKAMASRISGPKILLLQSSIIYQRVEGKLLSLEPVIMQEHDYFRNIVNRIVSMKPDLVLVQKSVSRIAQELFNQMGVTLVLNVKASILERISRCTGAEILTSVDAHMGKPVLGTCQQFYVENFGNKALMFFEGCPIPEQGCSVLLRGNTNKQLKILKIILRQLVLMIYNWKLEKSYIMDQFASPSIKNNQLNIDFLANEQDSSFLSIKNNNAINANIQTELPDMNNSQLISNEAEEVNKFQHFLNSIILSLSPLVNFSVPYLESDTGKHCKLRKYFSKHIYLSKILNNIKPSIDYNEKNEQLELELNLKPKHAFITTKLTEDIKSDEVQNMLALFRAEGGRIIHNQPRKTSLKSKTNNFIKKENIIDVFDPVNHQRLPVMFYSFCPESNNAPSFCVEPRLVFMEFYGVNDICLGRFLERYCFRESYECPSDSCDSPMNRHERRYIHDKGCIKLLLSNISGRLIDPPYNENLIYTWSYCKKCFLMTPVVPVSEDTWSFSFAKYLELKFHSQQSSCRALPNCDHWLNRDFLQFFVYNKTIASFEYSDIKMWEIRLPSFKMKIVSIKVSQYRPDILEEVKQWALMGHEIFNAVMTKICSLSLETNANFQSLKQQLQKDQGLFKQRVDDIQLRITSPTLTDKDTNYGTILNTIWKLDDSMVLLKKAVSEATINWNSRLIKIEAAIKKEDKSQKKSESKSNSTMSEIIEEVMNSECNTSHYLIEEHGITSYLSQHSLASESEIAAEHDFENLNYSDAFHSGKCYLSVPQTQSDITTDSDSDAVDDCDNSIQNEPKSQLSISQSDKKSVKNILSQFLPSSTPPAIIPNPIESTEHHVLNIHCRIPISIYEKEPSSIIAFTLSTSFYQNNISNTELMSDIENIDQENDQKEADDKSKSNQHFEITFSDSTTNFYVKVYFAKQFAKVRDTFFVSGEEMYIRSLARCVSWSARGGKSGSNFCKTKDDRFVLKEMSRLEILPFLEFAPQYFAYIHTRQTNRRPTLLCKIVGVYKVRYRNTVKGTSFNSNLLVMENLFYDKNISHIFDLKGSVRNRLVDPNSQDGEIVLLDENLIKMSCESPLYVHPHSKIILNQAINDDAEFLTSQLVMDYSLLVGLDENSGELVLGIIDYIRTFTWDKKIETMVKKSGLLGGQGKLPTIISPEEYKNRFVAAMNLYFLSVPNRWTGMAKGFEYFF